MVNGFALTAMNIGSDRMEKKKIKEKKRKKEWKWNDQTWYDDEYDYF